MKYAMILALSLMFSGNVFAQDLPLTGIVCANLTGEQINQLADSLSLDQLDYMSQKCQSEADIAHAQFKTLSAQNAGQSEISPTGLKADTALMNRTIALVAELRFETQSLSLIIKKRLHK